MLELDRLSHFFENTSSSIQFFSFTQEINKDFFVTLHTKINADSVDLYYWKKPNENFTIIAFGSTFSINQKSINEKIDGLNILNQFKKTFTSNLQFDEQVCFPLFVGSKKFPLEENSSLWKNFNSSEWLIPKFLFLQLDEKYFLTLNFYRNDYNPKFFQKELDELAASSTAESISAGNAFKEFESNDSTLSEWTKIVEKSLEKISQKELEKVVVARNTELTHNKKINLSQAVAALETIYPACYIFVIRKKGSTFFGATPDKLFKISDKRIETDALAGSIQRGDNKIIDDELGHLLLESEKDLNEHNSVRNFLLEKLYSVTDKIEYDCKPKLRKLSNIQHLWTPISAKLKDDFDLFSLIKNLYPTPAICGYPTETALKTISSLENFDRGLYSGIIGWFNLHNEAEFAVALRSGLLSDNRLIAFAGCGIVEGSDPYMEFKETELKLKPILSLFINETISQP